MKIFFYLLVLLVPTQLGRHFWPNFSFVQGIRVDYLSPTIYLTDILLVLLLLSWIFTKLSTFNFQLSTCLRRYWLLIVLAPIVIGIGIYSSSNPFAGLFGVIRLFEFFLLGVYIAKTINTRAEINRIIFLLAVGLVFESMLAIGQFINQGSLGSLFWFFGERTFTSGTIGIAQAIINGELILRPYGTFPHPNVLAGFLLIVMTMIIPSKRIFFLASLLIGSVALILTMSRIAIILWAMTLVGWFLRRFKYRIFQALVFIIITISIVAMLLWPRLTSLSLTDEAFVRRQELAVAAINMIRTHPLFGVGINNFLVNLPNFQQTKSTLLYLQPVHNIYLLIAVETGIIGFSIFVWFMIKTFKQLIKSNKFSILNSQPSIILLVILILGFFDHYFLTLQSGQLLFTLIVGLCWAKIRI